MHPILTPELLIIARGQGVCPRCHVDWRALEGTLADKGNAEDYATAYSVVQNCPCC